jgi:hypothetical protein
VAALGHARNRRVSRFWLRSCVQKVSHRLSTSKGPPMIGSVARRRHYSTCLLSDAMTPFSRSQSNPHVFGIRPARAIFASMAGHVVIRITERLGGGEPLRTAYAVDVPNQHRAVALFKLRPDHTADEQVEAVVELTQSALDSLGLRPGMIKPY